MPHLAGVLARHLRAGLTDVQGPVPLVRVGGDLVVQVQLVPHGAQALRVGGGDPLVDGDSVGVEVPLEDDPVPLPGAEAVRTVQHDVLQSPVTHDGRHEERVQSDGRHGACTGGLLLPADMSLSPCPPS